MVYRVYVYTYKKDRIIGANFVKEDDLKSYIDKWIEKFNKKYNYENYNDLKFEIYPQF